MSQLTYNWNPPIGRVGMVAEMRESNVIVSKVATAATTVGLLCSPSTIAEIGMLPAATSTAAVSPGSCKPFAEVETLDDTTFIGVALFDASRPPNGSLDSYAVGESVPVLRKGVVWVNVPDATVTAFTTTPFVWADPDGDTTYPLGTFLAGSNSGKGLAFTRGQYLTSSASGGGLVILEIW
jgi:hypothetical protein